MKIIRSAQCSLKFSTSAKRLELGAVLTEYGRVCNLFIDSFWEQCPTKAELLKDIVNAPDSWLSARLRKVCAREAIDMIKASQEKTNNEKKRLLAKAEKAKSATKANQLRQKAESLIAVKPKHKGNRMNVSCTIADLQMSKTNEFDAWLHLASIGNKIVMNLPIRFHKHFNKWDNLGKRLNSYIITKDSVQFCFEIETGEKKQGKNAIGIDSGINALASFSNGEQLGRDIKGCVNRINRCQHGSKGQKRARRALKQQMDEVAKQIVSNEKIDLVVVEKLSNLNHKTKERRRLSKNMRRVIGSWVWRYWLNRVQMGCEENRVSFRTVPCYNTSITCPECGHADKKNRNGEIFLCLGCGHKGNADTNAGRNILNRFFTGPYGAGFKPVSLRIFGALSNA